MSAQHEAVPPRTGGSAFFGAAPRGRRTGVPVGFHVVIGIGGLLVLLVASILVAVFLVARIKGDSEQLSDRDVPYSNHVAEAALAAKGIANDERGFLLTGELEFVYEADQRIDEALVALAAAERAATSTGQRIAVARARQGFDSWIQRVRAEFAGYQTGQKQATISAALGPDRQLRKRYEQSLAKAQALGATATETAQTKVATVSADTVTILLVCLIAALTFGVGIALWLIRAILRPVYVLLALLGDHDLADADT